MLKKLDEATVLSATQKGHLLYIEPIKNLRRLSLTWELPPAAVLDEEGRLGDLIAYSLSSQGENSLFQLLQKEGFADHLHAEVNRLSKTCALLSLEIDLTKTGVAHIDDVCAHTFQTLAYLKQSSVPPQFL